MALRTARVTLRRTKRTIAEMRTLVRQFDKEWEGGKTRAEAALTVGASVSTVDRWRNKVKRNDQGALVGEPIIPDLDVASAIKALISVDLESVPLKLEALFIFMAWLRWPRQPLFHRNAVAVYLAAYAQQRTNAVSIQDLPDSYLKVITRNVILDEVKRGFGSESENYVDFSLYTFFDTGYHDYDLAAFIVRLLLDDASKGRSRVSLTKAFNILANGRFNNLKFFGNRWLYSFWSKIAPSAVFSFVDHYHPEDNITYFVNPLSPSFAEEIDAIIGSTIARVNYFAKCRWTAERLRDRLDPRAVRSIGFPTFPDDLASLDASMPPAKIASEPY